jgi:hypothetical protein
MRRTLALACIASLQACVFVPRTTKVFDPGCQVVSNRMVLQEVQIEAIHRCNNEHCIALVMGAGLTAAASAVISGTIVVAGNVAYWLEKQGQCRPAT